jgi:hypothetical protein
MGEMTIQGTNYEGHGLNSVIFTKISA